MSYYKEYEYYCPKCGNMCFVEEKNEEYRCAVCEHKMIETPHEYELKETYFSEIYTSGLEKEEKEYRERIWKEREQRLYDEVISKSPVFTLDLYNRKDEIREQNYQEWKESQAQGAAILAGTDKGNPYGVTCPYCKATNVKKLGALSRTISAGLFGIGSGKIGKQWHCTHCGSDF